jgi:outer membrane receptor protein involved in Fe transport
MAIRAIGTWALLLVLIPCSLQAEEILLSGLIDAVRAQGHRIVYSSALVDPRWRVDVETVSLASLQSELRAVGLDLEPQGDIWVIVRGPDAEPANASDAPTIEPPVLENVIVTGSMHTLPYIGRSHTAFSFAPEDLALVPTLGSDAVRATLRLPGVSSAGVSAKPRIRGGLQDELLVMQDGVELLEPFHLADYHSPYSSIDYHTIESLDVYTGGFPSRYGYRMSGVMDIRNEWQEDDYNTDIGISSFSNFIHTRGTFGDQRPVDWLLSLRQGDLTELTDYIDVRSGDPIYKDASARLKIQWSEQLDLSAGFVYGNDDIVFEDEEEHASSRIDTRYAWLGADTRLSNKLASRLTLSWLDFERNKDQASFEIDEEDPGKGGFLDHKQQVTRAALRNDWSLIAPDAHWEFGWQGEYSRSEYAHRSQFDRGDLADILGTEAEVERDIRVKPRGWSGGAYTQVEWDITPKFSISPSLRWDIQDYYLDQGSELQWSPRLGLAYQWTDETIVRLSLGRYHQQEGVQELQVIDGVTQFFAPQRSDQIIAGLYFSKARVELAAEVYYKRYGDTKGRFENIFNPFVLLPELEPDRVGLWPDRAVARGVDLDGRLALLEPLNAYVRYSYMHAQDRLNNQWVDRRWSQRHTVNSGLAWQGETFSLSLAVTWHSGWRSARMPAFVAEDTVVPVERVLNNSELDDYFSLDVGARKFWELSRVRIEVYADIINITDHKNAAGVDYDVEEVDGGYELTPDTEVLLGRVPSVGITLSF